MHRCCPTLLHSLNIDVMARFHSRITSSIDPSLNPRMLTLRAIIECAVARPSRIIRTNFDSGKIVTSFRIDLSVNGSLLHRRGARAPCFAMMLSMYAPSALSRTSLVTFACDSRCSSFAERCMLLCMARMRGMTRVSSPQRTSGCASSIARISVVPLRGTPPIHIIGTSFL